MPTQTIYRPYGEARPATFGRRSGQRRLVSGFTPPGRSRALRGLLIACALATPFWLTLCYTVFLLLR
jgi:hypothetical protein